MARQKQEYDWIDDPFNDEKSQAEIDAAKRSRRLGCVISALVLVLLVVVIGVVSCNVLNSAVSI